MYRRCRCFALLQPASQIPGRVQRWGSAPTYAKPASSRYCAQSHGIPNRVLADVWTLISHLPPFRRANLSQASSYDLPRIFHGWRMHAGSFFPAVFLQCFPRQNSRSLHLRLSKPPIDHQAVFSLSLPRRITRFVSQFPSRKSIAPAKPGILPPWHARNCRALPPYFRRTERRRPRFNVPWGTSDANLPISFAEKQTRRYRAVFRKQRILRMAAIIRRTVFHTYSKLCSFSADGT